MANEEVRSSKSAKGAKLLWYPDADVTAQTMATAGLYKNGYPRGALVHYTSGRSLNGDRDARNTVAWGAKQGYVYFCISRTGRIYQSFPLNRWGSHAGQSSWPGLQGTVGDELVGIEICCAGLLNNKKTAWFGETYEDSEVRYLKESRDGLEPAGYYHKYTAAQEVALKRLLLWLKNNNPDVFDLDLVVGHHEVSPKRKQDPGGSLSVSMKQFREELKKEYADHFTIT